MRYVQPVVKVNRFAECVRFYRDMLQMELVRGSEDGPIATLSSGGHELTLLDSKALPSEATDLTTGSNVTLAFRAVDIDLEYDRLHRAGVRYSIKPQNFPKWGVRSSVCVDPDGNAVEIVPEGSVVNTAKS